MEFTGFPVAALDFYDDLEVENTKAYWEQHRQVYEQSVKAPMVALTAVLAKEFAPDGQSVTIFRPYRDVRFAKDKTPYKTHQGAFVRVADATGWYVEVSPRGVRTGGGFYHADQLRLAALRESIADEVTGPAVLDVLDDLRSQGFEIGGDTLKTAPRGYERDHPRIELLRHKSIVATHLVGFDPVIHTADLLDVVRRDWQATRALVAWAAELQLD